MRILSPSTVLLLGLVAGCSAGPADADMKNEDVSIETAADLLAGGSEVVVLDIRTPAEYEAGHIPGAMLIDCKAPDFAQKLAELDKSKTYVMH